MEAAEEEVTVRLAAAKDISMDAAEVAVISELDGIFAFKKEQRTAPNAFLLGKNMFLFYSQLLLGRV